MWERLTLEIAYGTISSSISSSSYENVIIGIACENAFHSEEVWSF